MYISKLKKGIKNLSPGYFALPMSTGIITIASFLLGYHKISSIAFIINNIEIVVLSLLFILRLIYYYPSFKKDLQTPQKGAEFLTIVIAICVYGTKNILLEDNLTLVLLGWCLSFILWLIFIFSFFTALATSQHKFSLSKGLNGTWLLFVVSAQALSISGNLVASHFEFQPQVALFITSMLFLLGGLFYIIIIGLIFYRFLFLPMKPADFHPSYWINMGAAAISTLAGAILVIQLNGIEEFKHFIPTVKVMTIFYWIVGTWWIPIILYMEIWKRSKIKVSYSPDYWSLVFPVGMYTICTWYLAIILDLPVLKSIPLATLFLAFATWFITYIQLFIKSLKTYLDIE